MTKWLKNQYGDGKKFVTRRQLSLACFAPGDDHINEGLIGQIETRGTAKPDTLRRVAEALGISPIHIFIEAEWIQASDVTATSGELLSGRQLDAARIVGGLPDDFAGAWLESGEAVMRLVHPRVETRREAEIETRETRRGRG